MNISNEKTIRMKQRYWLFIYVGTARSTGSLFWNKRASERVSEHNKCCTKNIHISRCMWVCACMICYWFRRLNSHWSPISPPRWDRRISSFLFERFTLELSHKQMCIRKIACDEKRKIHIWSSIETSMLGRKVSMAPFISVRNRVHQSNSNTYNQDLRDRAFRQRTHSIQFYFLLLH